MANSSTSNTKGRISMTSLEQQIFDRLDRIEVAVGQLAYAAYGPTVGGSAKGPLVASFIAGFERRREEQTRQARADQARRELADLEREPAA